MDAYRAANTVGGSPSGRPEDVEVHPADGSVFIAFTGVRRTPRPLVRTAMVRCGAWRKRGAIERARAFRWSRFSVGGPPDPARTGHVFTQPDNLVIDRRGDLWVATDIARGARQRGRPLRHLQEQRPVPHSRHRARPRTALAVRVAALRGGGHRARLRSRRERAAAFRPASGRAVRHAPVRLRRAAREQLARAPHRRAPAAGGGGHAPAMTRLKVSLLITALAGSVAPTEAARTTVPAADYSVTAGEGARELRVEATFKDAPAGGLVFADGMGRHVRDAEAARGHTPGRPLPSRTTPSPRPAAAAGAASGTASCSPRPRVAGARTTPRSSKAARWSRPPPCGWCAPPSAGRAGTGYASTTPPGLRFATGIFPAGPAAYEADLADLPEAPYSAFGPFEPERLRVPGAEVEVAILPGETALDRAALLSWVERAAGDVAAYFDRFPLPRALVIVIPSGRRAVGFGTTMGNGGASIMIWVGPAAREDDLRRDWVLTHEMVHLGLPNLPRAQRWMEEGLATYVEPIARARAGISARRRSGAGSCARRRRACRDRARRPRRHAGLRRDLLGRRPLLAARRRRDPRA